MRIKKKSGIVIKKDKKTVKPTRKEKPVVVNIANIDYIPRPFSRKHTRTNDELNLYIPEKWQR